MAQSGFTPIQLYFSTTAAATPSAGNLANGELAINITDGRLFYKDNGGTVRVLAGTGGSGVVAGSNTQVQFNNNGVFGASANMVFNGTRLTVADLADSGLTSGRVTYASTGGALVDSANLTFDGNILSTTSAAIGGTLGMTVGGALNGTTINSTGVLLGGTQTLTINAGTANGVAYLNGSKVLTTGSALTFDGTSFAVGGIGTFGSLNAQRFASSPQATLTIGDNATPANDVGIYFRQTSGVSGFSTAGAAFAWYNGSPGTGEQMRLTSTGLGIGTSSPGAKLDVVDAGNFAPIRLTSAAGTNIRFNTTRNFTVNRNWIIGCDHLSEGAFAIIPSTAFGGGTFSNAVYAVGSNGIHTWSNGSGSERMRLDSSGNLGLGVTPSAWQSTWKVQQFPNGYLASTNASAMAMGNNNYYDGSTYRYVNSGVASQYQQDGVGGHFWRTAPSGTAGNAISFTQAMTLDASGVLGLGTSSPQGVGGSAVHVNDTNNPAIRLTNSSTGATSTDGTAIFVGNAAGTGTTSLNLYNYENSPTVFFTNQAERARITSGGDLLVGTTTQIGSEKFGVVSGSSAAGKFKGGNDANVTVDMWNPATSGDNIFVAFRTETAETTRGSITYNRTAGLTAYNTTSDYRAKDIIGPVTDSGALIDSTPVYMGKMKGATQERPMFIAHEVPAYAHTGVKDAVDADGKPVYQQMDASALVPVLWAELQSLRARVAALESN